MKKNHAPKREDGMYAYLITKHSRVGRYRRIGWATSLEDAKEQFGSTILYKAVTVSRATIKELAEFGR